MISSWLMAAALQPATYSPVRQSVSVLAGHGGRDRWLVTGALFVAAGLYLLTALSLVELPFRARLGSFAVALCAVGIALSPQPVHGSTDRHVAFTVIGAFTIAIWPLLAFRRSAPDSSPTGLRTACIAAVVFLALLVWTLIEAQHGAHLGLSERISSGIQECWPGIVACQQGAADLAEPPAGVQEG